MVSDLVVIEGFIFVIVCNMIMRCGFGIKECVGVGIWSVGIVWGLV